MDFYSADDYENRRNFSSFHLGYRVIDLLGGILGLLKITDDNSCISNFFLETIFFYYLLDLN